MFAAAMLPLATPMIANAMPMQFFAKITPGDGGGTSKTCILPDGTKGAIQSDGHTCCPFTTNDNTSCLYSKYINPAIQLLSALIGLVIVISIIYGGIEYIMAEGDPQKAAAGRKRIINALFALAAFLLLYGFLQFIVPGGVLNG